MDAAVLGPTTSDREFAVVRLSAAVRLAGGLLYLSLKLFLPKLGGEFWSVFFYRIFTAKRGRA